MFCDGGGVILYYQNLALLAIWGIEIRAGKDIWGDMGEYKICSNEFSMGNVRHIKI
jgi:hypothetical protein